MIKYNHRRMIGWNLNFLSVFLCCSSILYSYEDTVFWEKSFSQYIHYDIGKAFDVQQGFYHQHHPLIYFFPFFATFIYYLQWSRQMLFGCTVNKYMQVTSVIWPKSRNLNCHNFLQNNLHPWSTEHLSLKKDKRD